MHKLWLTGLYLLPTTLLAQNVGGMNQAQMQQLMQQAQSVQNCMSQIDEAEMAAFEQQAEAMDTEVKALCAAGKRDAAQARAMTFGQTAANNPVMQAMQRCGQNLQAMALNLPKTVRTPEDTSSPKHICDE